MRETNKELILTKYRLIAIVYFYADMSNINH